MIFWLAVDHLQKSRCVFGCVLYKSPGPEKKGETDATPFRTNWRERDKFRSRSGLG